MTTFVAHCGEASFVFEEDDGDVLILTMTNVQEMVGSREEPDENVHWLDSYYFFESDYKKLLEELPKELLDELAEAGSLAFWDVAVLCVETGYTGYASRDPTETMSSWNEGLNHLAPYDPENPEFLKTLESLRDVE